MKHKMEFKLPKERSEMLEALHGGEAFIALEAVRQIIRSYRKNGPQGTIDDFATDINEAICDALQLAER